MNKSPQASQFPDPGKFFVMYCGDCFEIRLELNTPCEGTAFVRTNLGGANKTRKEIINRVEKDEIRLDGAWYDIRMPQKDKTVYEIVLPLNQVGHFQAKCCFIPEGGTVPVWPPGDNLTINVEPAGTCCSNIIYNAFVRQFSKKTDPASIDSTLAGSIAKLDEQGYTVIPESGKFRDLIERVPFIFNTLGCRVLHLLPVHPVPTTYARMGRFGSPYAALNFTQVDPGLAQFDPAATPLEQFLELVDCVHYHNGYLFMDIAINHTGWAAAIHETHPEWLVRDDENNIQAPGAWGVVWADLTRLDYSNRELWQYMAQVFLVWCERGVDGFRCDAGYMVPTEAWEYIVAKVRQQFPQTLFFLEGLGGPIKTTRDILNKANFNWAYSELFQNYTREQISGYLPQAIKLSQECGSMIHFAETHDNNRLAAQGECYARMRTALCALSSVNGGFGFANGVEWFATQKIDVHELSDLNWGAQTNQVEDISRLNALLKFHPAFFSDARIELIQENESECIVLFRQNKTVKAALLIIVNLDCEGKSAASFSDPDSGVGNPRYFDVLSGRPVKPIIEQGKIQIVLEPGQVMVLSSDPGKFKKDKPVDHSILPPTVYDQKMKAVAMRAWVKINGYNDISGIDLNVAAAELGLDPVAFLCSLNHESDESRVVVFDADRDFRRCLMVPPGFFLLIKARAGFRAHLTCKTEKSSVTTAVEEGLALKNGEHFFALFHPPETTVVHRQFLLHLRVFETSRAQIKQVPILYLAPFEQLKMTYEFTRKQIIQKPYLKLLGTTHLGAMMRAPVFWGRLDSRYDALLAANLSVEMPENRWVVFSRCRIWAVFQGHSKALAPDCLERFRFNHETGGRWLFQIPTSEGKFYELVLSCRIARSDNHICLSVERPKADIENPALLEDERQVTLIFRPDIEDRSFHDTVKAYQGPEQQWPGQIEPSKNRFDFKLSGSQIFRLSCKDGVYVHEPEWQYMVHRPLEAERGLDADSDLFSPGYFSAQCVGGQTIVLDGEIVLNDPNAVTEKSAVPVIGPGESIRAESLDKAVYKSLDAFLVDRSGDKSVIAGYPWFLDWGRDSLIFCRGLIELSRFDEAGKILRLFGQFEDQGTLPNMICGSDAGNRETSDAPLWFFTCCRDLVLKQGNRSFLKEKLGDRSVEQILVSMALSMINGTPTGVRTDPESMLLYSPSHFTWMDTNFPAGTPRQGYPVEIQALWYNALDFLGSLDIQDQLVWAQRAKQVKKWVNRLFFNPDLGYFSDCLHASDFDAAQKAQPDDALRSNQLFLISFDVVEDPLQARQSIETCQELLVPGGIRSLADRRVEYPIEILYNGRTINDPHHPYSGIYSGDEDTARKPAYHNGTAWTWPFPVFCEAWAKVFGPQSYATCLAWLGSVLGLMRKGSVGYIPEILDGDYPHTPRGCDAQAWSSSEFARVIHKLKN